MNQILFSKSENFNNNYNKKKSKKSYVGQTKQIEITKIVKFFSIVILLFGVCITGGISYSWVKNAKEDNANVTKPVINIQSDAENTLLLSVNHDKAIKEVSYQWVGQDEVKINADNHMYVEEKIDIPAGTNTLTITATDVNNQTTSYSQQYSGASKPNLSLSVVDNKIKATVSSEKQIDYVQYKWDEGEVVSEQVNDNYYEQMIEIPQGLHTLTIIAVDVDKMVASKTQTVNGVTKPTVNITSDGTNLIVQASDNDMIEKAVVIFNGEEKTFEVNDKQFEYSVPVVDGENVIEATVYNKSGLSQTAKARGTR